MVSSQDNSPGQEVQLTQNDWPDQEAPEMTSMQERVNQSEAFAQYMKRHRRTLHDDSLGY